MKDFLPSASIEMLRRRALLLKQLRRFFDERGFLEVETPLLSRDSVVDRHLDPLSVTLFDDARRPEEGERRWLQTSPEFGMKRLLTAMVDASGRDSVDLPAIYQITRAFRGGETGALHNPEFTIVEWYRVGDDYEAGMALLGELAHGVFGQTAQRITFRQAFIEHAGFDPCGTWNHREIAQEMSAVADRYAVLDYIHTTRVEPRLGRGRPTILHDYPADQSALAQVRQGDPPVAERFELYVNGVELANGYHELLDPAVLLERNRVNNHHREADGKYPLPEESRLLEAMRHGLPACSGCALGFDRLVMVATGASTVQEVMAFPSDRA